MPTEDIDQAMIWIVSPADASSCRIRSGFPSWSWSSHHGPIKHLSSKGGLACWAIPREQSTEITLCQAKTQIWVEERPASDYNQSVLDPFIQAWLTGCIEAPFPISEYALSSSDSFAISTFPLNIRLSNEAYWQSKSFAIAAAERWPTYAAFWHDAFGRSDEDRLFPRTDRELASASPGRILFYGQTASFHCEPFNIAPDSTHNQLCIRRAGSFAGAIHLPRYHTALSQGGLGEFLLLSVAVLNDLGPHLKHQFEATYKHYKDTQPAGVDGICHNSRLDFDDRQSRFPFETKLIVMLIERNPETGIARRLGVGFILLDEWFHAERRFKTVVLE